MRVIVAMSGGVDSSAAALLLREQGHEVVGVTMMLTDCTAETRDSHLFPPDGNRMAVPSCCGRQAVRDAQKVAARLDIPHYVLDLRAELETEVIRDFCDEYGRGRTPNPCIRCNERLKFRSLLGRAGQLGAEKLATGHYARLVQDEQERWLLARARDRAKDQSYFLYRLTPEQTARLVLPLGELTKAEVRDVARRGRLPVAEKRESQEICFVAGGDYRAFLKERRPEMFRPGLVVDTEGRTLGRHDGIAGFTIGQRKGLGIALGERYYVVDIDPERNLIVLGRKSDAYGRVAELEEMHWIAGQAPGKDFPARVKIRQQHVAAQALVEPARARVTFDEPQWALTPGQAAVFYDGDRVLGGGTISRRLD